MNPERPLALWLLLCCTLIYAMIVLGGVTRLTGSGLSIVQWEPLVGTIPPLSRADWEEVFEEYQTSPEFQKKNFMMTLDDFKRIFWYEYAHRLLGRTIGVVFLVPLLYFWVRRRIPHGLAPKLATLFVLGGLQGALGWYMVKSGLVDDPHVSQYRLAARLTAALIIYAYMLWVAMDLWFARGTSTVPAPPAARTGAWLITALALLTMVSGAFVAGLKAGFAYNTFPWMDGHWMPEAMWLLEPRWRNLFENIATVQFNHRWIAISVYLLITIYWAYAARRDMPAHARFGVHALFAVAGVQVALGISTLVLHVPVALAAAHQAGAVALLSAALFVAHAFRVRAPSP